MKTTLKLIFTGMFLSLLAGLAATSTAYAQGQIPSGTIAGSGSGPFNYSLSFSDAPGAITPIGSVWYSWVPGFFYLPGVPTGASAPAGWTATVSGNSVQFVANSPADDIQPGQSLSGFGYAATFSPAQLAAAPNSALSDAYSAGLFSDAGVVFAVQTVPEPSSLGLLTSGLLGLVLVGGRKLCKSATAA